MCEQKIYFGAPGTGKSHKVDEVTADSVQIRVTIHPEYTYSDFVGQILPIADGDKISFQFVPGPFTRALQEAFGDRNRKVALILEELSRGNVAAVFGDMFQLLDRNTDGRSAYPVYNADVASQIRETAEGILSGRRDEVLLPANLSIYATVNLNDQNVVPMDTAFKRRFDWEYIPIDPVLGENGDVLNNPSLVVVSNSEDGNVECDWKTLYMTLDKIIVDKENGLGRDEDRQIGQFFVKFSPEDIRNSKNSDLDEYKSAEDHINRIIANKLLMYLWQDVQGRGIPTESGMSLFSKNIQSFHDLFESYNDENQVFSNEFIDKLRSEISAEEDAS